MIVADTCLVFHLFNETSLTATAQEILEKDPHWVLPSLWKEEYANVLSKLAKKESYSAKKVISHFQYTVAELEGCSFVVDTEKALEVAMQHQISVYDAHFVALAMGFNTIVVTEDREIIKKCPRLAKSFEAMLRERPS